MSATPQINANVKPVGTESAVQTGLEVPQPASSQIGQGQLATISPSTGYAALNDGTIPNQIGAGIGYPGKLTQSNPTAAQSVALLWQGQFREMPASTIANDGIAITDVGKTWFIANENTPGILSNSSGSNRSMGGVILGLFNKLPHLLGGVVGWLLARAAHGADNESAGTIAYASDATASTDQGTAADPLLIPRRKLHGHITSIEIIPSADLALALTNYRVVTIYKINTLTNVVGPTVGTFSTLTQNLAKRTPTQFTLSATATDLDMLETDILGFASLHTAGGATIPQSVIRVNMKVQ